MTSAYLGTLIVSGLVVAVFVGLWKETKAKLAKAELERDQERADKEENARALMIADARWRSDVKRYEEVIGFLKDELERRKARVDANDPVAVGDLLDELGRLPAMPDQVVPGPATAGGGSAKPGDVGDQSPSGVAPVRKGR